MWWMKLWPLTPLIIVAILVGCLIAVIILICIIICMCRRRRKRSSKSKKSFPKCEIQNEKLRRSFFAVYSLLILSSTFFCHSAGMEKSLVDNKPNDPNAEPCENYENLPFHGLQNPPTKVRQTILPQIPPRRVLVLCKLLALIAVVTFPPLLASTSFTARVVPCDSRF